MVWLGRVEAGEEPSRPIDPLVGADAPDGSRSVRGGVEVDHIREHRPVLRPVAAVDRVGDRVQRCLDSQTVGELFGVHWVSLAMRKKLPPATVWPPSTISTWPVM